MMRPMLILPALAVFAGLLAATPAVAAETVESENHSAYTSFRLAAANGLQVHVTGENGLVTIEVRREGRRGGSVVFYRTQGESTEEGMKAQFGQLGLIDVHFTPTKTRLTVPPPKGCKGEPTTYREGFFAGTIEFTGEREYVHFDKARVDGKMNVNRTSEWQCPRYKGSRRLQRASRTSTVPSGRKKRRERQAWLVVASDSCSCALLVYAERDAKGHGRTGFLGLQREDLEGMEISRGTYVEAGSSAFFYNHDAGTATAHPPRPFSGDGAFKRGRHGHNLWRSTIQIPFLGTGRASISGDHYRVVLRRHIPYDE
jgi:hypothetical protein